MKMKSVIVEDAMVPKVLERQQTKMVRLPPEHDKRYFTRWGVNKRVDYIEEAEAGLRAYTRDLSLDGISLFVYGDLPAQHRVRLRIHLADKENFEARGRVVWKREEPTHKLLGIAFEGLGKKACELILRHAFELEIFRIEGTSCIVIQK